MLNDGLVRDLTNNDLPLCPNIGYPGSKAHELKNRIIDSFYDYVETDSDGEFLSPEIKTLFEKVNRALTDHMRLYKKSSIINGYSGQTVVKAFYYKCDTCGFILPATQYTEYPTRQTS